MAWKLKLSQNQKSRVIESQKSDKCMNTRKHRVNTQTLDTFQCQQTSCSLSPGKNSAQTAVPFTFCATLHEFPIHFQLEDKHQSALLFYKIQIILRHKFWEVFNISKNFYFKAPRTCLSWHNSTSVRCALKANSYLSRCLPYMESIHFLLLHSKSKWS